MTARRACDRCYRYKEKCVFQDDGKTCTPCKRVGRTCTTLRSLPRQGRRPTSKRLGPGSSVQVWEVTSTTTATSESTSTPSYVGASVAGGCSPTIYDNEVYSNDAHFQTLVPGPYTYRFQDNLNELFHSSPKIIEGFYSTYDLFMLGPTFVPRYRAAIRQSYICSPVLLQDIYAAMFNACKRARVGSGAFDVSELAPGAMSLRKLRTTRVGGLQDALAMLALGQTLAAFDYLTVCVGPSLILRYTLSSIRPWYEELGGDATFDPLTVGPIFWDTVSCLLRREIPILQFWPREGHIVHHMVGLCTTLLPIFYDLCVVIKRLKNRSSYSWSEGNARIRQIEQRLLSWTPKAPHDFISTFSRQEILAMKAQAQMYRSAGLLIAHRTLHPLGTGDDLATSYANTIIFEFTQYQTSMEPGAGLHNVAFPIFMASLEILEIPKEVWKSIPSLALAPLCFAKMQALRAYVWAERRASTTRFMLDLVDEGPYFVVMP
ncbi:hypothetical protein A1O3_08987 [Capronia epimyces CBS 606.96]|uniref:Zn(2)-C6 fungal-type domain-containing protein n=1 Tax=Capronia epimyces CBS 606.96 TaxID=1182542 RepID=W9XC86_9EURO|nr:uncharacterized protein A1O3_08987 [Capronia epimyces CBS 606.96]EXJ77828.1 hypothetical protein A1O3_08987 [Capronia epimyces CBS 606.96]